MIRRENSRENTWGIVRKIVTKSLIYAVLVLLSLVILIPFYVILITSFKSNMESSHVDFTWWPRMGFHLDGYKKVLFDATGALAGANILRGFVNTLWMNVPMIVVGMFVSAVSAYAFAKMKFKCSNLLFSVLLGSMMVPSSITMVPTYLMFDKLGWIDTPMPIMIPGMFGMATTVFFLRQYFKGISNELIGAAKIDGLGHFRICLLIIIPMSSPALISQFLLNFIGRYNDYLTPLLYLQSDVFITLQLALRNSIGTYSQDWQTIMAGCVVSMVPLMVIYAFTQKLFIKGISMSSGLKG